MRTPEKASNINGKKFLPVNTDPSIRVKGVLGKPVALKPLTIKVPTITKRPGGVSKKLEIWGGENSVPQEEANPIPVFKKGQPHGSVLAEFCIRFDVPSRV